MADEAPKPDPQPQPAPVPSVPSTGVRKARRAEHQARLAGGSRPGAPAPKTTVRDVILGTICFTTAAGIVFAIAIPGMLSSQGARHSVRIEWERRGAELDAIAEQARKDGKLPPFPESKPRE